MRQAKEVRIEYYVDNGGRRPCEEWVNGLESHARDIVLDAILKRRLGNIGQSKPVGGGVHELRPRGFRIYYGVYGDRLIVLLGGGTKKRQQVDIDNALSRWQDFKIKVRQARKYP